MKRTVVVILAALACLPALAACGSSANGEAAKSPTQILADAERATSGASVVHIAGNFVAPGSRLALDIVDGHGSGGGRITENGLAFQIVLTGKSLYLRAGVATWTKAASAQVAKLVADRWIQLPSDNPEFSGLIKLVDVSALVAKLKPTGAIAKRAATTVDGVSVIPLVARKKGTLYVAASGKPYIIAVRGDNAAGNGQFTFDQYGTAKVPGVPRDAINISALEHSAG